MKTLMLLAAPRTGTNYLMNLLAHRRDLLVKHEVFHPVQAYGFEGVALSHFCERTGLSFEGPADPRLVKALSSHPAEAIAGLRAAAEHEGADWCVFKFFPGHGDGTLDAVRRLLPVVDRVAFVKRRVIDSYISVVKAEAVNRFFDTDTTALKPTLDVAHFQHWHGYTSRWYIDTTIEWIRHFGTSDVPVLRYEEFSAGDNSTNLGVIEQWLDERVYLGMGRPGDALVRQDRAGSPAEKVANHAEFVAELARLGLADVLDRHF